MAHGTETKFGDLQMQERYKKLERSLKLASLRYRNVKQNEPWALPVSPGISSINGDPFDSSTNRTIQSLQPCRIDNKVVSSSNNLRNIILKTKCINSDPEGKGIATSSVKKCNKERDISSDYYLMPPPNFANISHRIKNSNNVLPHKVPTFLSEAENGYNSFDIDIACPTKHNYYEVTNTSGKVTNQCSSLQINTNNYTYKRARIFRNWKVMLSELGQLVIKGTLECGSIARSKPISKRLTSTTAQSICNHVYHLQGNIVDDAHDLPDYIRGKFYNGFPDDWENVCEIWTSFVRQGSTASFHWPTKITDSDDDIKSDITCAYSRAYEDKSASSKCLKQSDLLFDSSVTNSPLQLRGKQNVDFYNYKKNDSSTHTCKLDTIGNSFHKGVHTEILSTQFDYDQENCKEQRIAEAITESLASQLRDKLNVILNNITHKKCPQARLSQYTKMFECLNYILSYGSTDENEFDSEAAYAGHKRHVAQQNSQIVKTCQDYLQREVSSMQGFRSNKIADSNSFLKRKRTFTEMNKVCCNSTSDGESELYTGIPKISLERIMQQKENSTKPRKRKIKRNARHSETDTMEKKGASNMPEIPSDNMKENINDKYFYDSGVSIIEVRKDNSMLDKYIRPTVRNDFHKHAESNIVKGYQQERSNVLLKNKHVHGMRGHIVQENCSGNHEPTLRTYNSYDAGDQDENEIAVSEKTNRKVSEINSSMKTKQDKESEGVSKENYMSSKQSIEFPSSLKGGMNKMNKPSIINSISTNIDMNIKPKCSLENQEVRRNEEVVITALVEESEPGIWKQIESARKSDAVKKSNTISVACSKECVEERAEGTLSNRDFASKELAPNTDLMQDNQVTNYNKPKVLSAWSPRVISKSGLRLIFEGKLLNDAGHVVCNKYRTDVVLHRISRNVIKTVNHKLYELLGELNNTKYVVPKELVMHCRYGCPIRIEQFCETWNALRKVDVESTGESKTLKDTSMDTINVGVSSKGRRIIPPLSYWTGERVAMKDNNPVYSPGTAQDTTCAGNKQVKGVMTRSIYGNQKAEFIESRNLTKSSPKRSVDKSAYECSKVKNKTDYERPKKRRRVIRQESSSSNDDSELSNVTKHKTKGAQQELFNLANAESERDSRSIAPSENSHESHTGVDGTEVTRSNLKASNKATSIYTSPSKQMPENHQSSSVKYRDVVCTYYQGIPAEDDELSEFQVSNM